MSAGEMGDEGSAKQEEMAEGGSEALAGESGRQTGEVSRRMEQPGRHPGPSDEPIQVFDFVPTVGLHPRCTGCVADLDELYTALRANPVRSAWRSGLP